MNIELYDKSLLVNIIENRLLDSFEDYCPQGQYNNKFIKYLYRYIRQNTYSGEHDELLRKLVDLQLNNDLFSNTKIREKTDRQTYVLTDDTGISSDMFNLIHKIVQEYYNYKYLVISENRIEFKIRFGWLPPTTASWLNILNDECLIDYYIDGITLRKNTHTLLSGPPDSGYVCYLIDSVKAFDTVLFLANTKEMELEGKVKPKIKVATILTEIEGSKGATLNRVVETDIDNFFYELGPYNQNYLTAQYSALVIQVPYEYAIDDYFYLYDVSFSVNINNNNNPDPNNQDNFFVAVSNPNLKDMFNKFKLNNLDKIIQRILNSTRGLNTELIQLLLGDFIWRTSDSKLIAYLQNLINALFTNAQLKPNGVWSDELSSLITRFKTGSFEAVFMDDVVDKATEEAMITRYKLMYNLDPNEELFNQW